MKIIYEIDPIEDRGELILIQNAGKYYDTLHDIVNGDIRSEWKHGEGKPDAWYEAIEWCREKISDYLEKYGVDLDEVD